MSVPFNRVLDGAAEFIERDIMPNMTDWQEIAARIALGRVFDNRDAIKNYFVNTGYLRTFALIDEDGNVDIDRLIADLKREIERKGTLEVNLKIFGKLRFDSSDADKLHRIITQEGSRYENH
jgi:hypothetical protein